MTDKCFICSNAKFNETGDYSQCAGCGHEISNGNLLGTSIVNEILLEDEIKKIKFLDRFQLNLLQYAMMENNFLLDMGSASGRFLYHSKKLFQDCAGIEITAQCIKFSREKLGLKIFKDISEIKNIVSVVTFWHSLEHIPFSGIARIFEVINKQASENLRIIISVPNRDSLMYFIFKNDCAYYDNSSHMHQFSNDSVGLLMKKFGFMIDRRFFSFPYSSFGYLQGFINKFNKIHNFLYYYKKRGQKFGKNDTQLFFLFVYNLALVLIFIFPSLFLTFFDFLFKNKGGVITICCSKIKK